MVKLQFYPLFLTVTDCVLARHRLNSWMISSYKSVNHQGIILNIRSALHQRCWYSECFQRHLMFYTCNYNIRVTHRNGAMQHIFYDQIHGDRMSVLYSFCRSMRLLFIAVKIFALNLSVPIETLTLHTSVGCISLQNASRTALCYATNTH